MEADDPVRATYVDSGVDIDRGDELVRRIAPMAGGTAIPGVLSPLGGFGALFDLSAQNFKEPLLVSTTDGVGTKLILAVESGLHGTIGIDLVAMCVNDLVSQGARPLFFLDYFACGSLNLSVTQSVVSGIAKACHQVGCALVGGETAEMPGLYKKGYYDLAGFALGAVDRAALLPKMESMERGDKLIGLASDGVHSNGFSLVRRVLEMSCTRLDSPCPFEPDRCTADVLLTPTRLYTKPVLGTLNKTDAVRAVAHITGGGLHRNVARVIPGDLKPVIDTRSWQRPEVFNWLKIQGRIREEEMLRVFNCGIGMVLVVRRDAAEETLDLLRSLNQEAYLIGCLE